jgi:hypothetical protein
LLAPATWLGAMQVAGFETACSWPPVGSAAEALGQHVIVARVPGEPFGAANSAVSRSNTSENMAAAAAKADVPVAPNASESLRAQLLHALPADRLDLLRDFVRERVVRVLKLPADQPPGRHDRLMDLGFDSLMAVQLRNQLGKGLGLERPLPATLMFDHPTIDALAQHLLERVAPAEPAGTAGVPTPAAAGTAPAVLSAQAVAAMSDEAIEGRLMERLGKP